MTDRPPLASGPASRSPLRPWSPIDQFHPGRWLECYQKQVPPLAAISGCYERQGPVTGTWLSQDLHYFDLCLGKRPAASRGRFDGYFRDLQPMGEVFLAPAGHRYLGSGGPGQQNNLFVFVNANACGEQDPTPDQGQVSRTALRACMDLRSRRIKLLLTQIARELHEPGFASEVLLEGLGLTLLAETLRLLQLWRAPVARTGGLSPRHMRLIKERVAETGRLPSLDELSAACQLSRRHLMRAFREQTGQTVGAYVQQVVMDKATHLLIHSDLPVSAVAAAVGFSSASAFSTAFRRATGETPRRFRAQHRVVVACSLKPASARAGTREGH